MVLKELWKSDSLGNKETWSVWKR